MSICTIFNKSLRNDADGTPVTKRGELGDLVPSFDLATSGIWKPLVIYQSRIKQNIAIH